MTTPATTRKAILIVEDDADTRETLRFLLESEGYTVLEAGHGKAALEHLATGCRPCLILLDLMMPVMSGFEFLQVFRRDPAHDVTPVVVASAWGREAETVQGAQGFLRKPFDLPELFDQVRRHC
jgi:CheY-like chemotaxis protein